MSRWQSDAPEPTCKRHDRVECQRCALDDRRERGQSLARGLPVHDHPDIYVRRGVRRPAQLERK